MRPIVGVSVACALLSCDHKTIRCPLDNFNRYRMKILDYSYRSHETGFQIGFGIIETGASYGNGRERLRLYLPMLNGTVPIEMLLPVNLKCQECRTLHDAGDEQTCRKCRLRMARLYHILSVTMKDMFDDFAAGRKTPGNKGELLEMYKSAMSAAGVLGSSVMRARDNDRYRYRKDDDKDVDTDGDDEEEFYEDDE